jgi:hypothetical protein
VDDPTAQGLANLAGLPMPGRLSPEEKARVVEDSVNWLRNNDTEDVNEHSYGSERTSGSTNAEGHIDSPRKRRRPLTTR